MTAREALITELGECTKVAPEIRVGQMLDFLNTLAHARQNKNLADLEDDELLPLVSEHRTEMSNRVNILPTA